MGSSEHVQRGDIRRYVTGGLLWSSIGLAASVVFAFLVNAIAARLLATADLAAFLLLISLGQTLGVLVELGLPPLVVRALSLNPQRPDVVFVANAWRAVGVAAVLVTVGAVVLARPFADLLTNQPAVVALSPWVGALIAIRGGERLAGDSFRGLRDIPRAVGFGSVGTQLAGTTLLGILLWYGLDDPDLAVGAYVLGGAGTVVWALVVLRRRLRRPAWGVDRRRYRPMLAESWPLIGHRGLFLVLQQAPLWIVGAVLAEAATADYGLAQRVVTLIGFPLLIVNQVVPPLISRGALDEPGRLERVLRATATAAAVPATLVLGALVIAGGPLLTLFFGSAYASAATPLAWLSVGQLANVLAGSCGPVLTQTGQQRVLWWITASVTAATLVLAWWVAEPYGVDAVAMVASLGLISQNVGMATAARRIRGLRTWVGITGLRDGLQELTRLVRSAPRR